jgi:hypothetical protein
MPYTIIKDYINKKGFTHQAHFSPSDKYIGPVTKFGSVPLSLSIKPYTNKQNKTHNAYFTPCNKYVEPARIPVVEVIAEPVIDPVIAQPVIAERLDLLIESYESLETDETLELDVESVESDDETLELDVESVESDDETLDKPFIECVSNMKYDELSDEYERLSINHESTKMKYVFKKMQELE